MLQLKGITKSYTTGNFTQVALNNVDLSFRKSEFVAILGPSGSGKTTCLNIIGGLDQYDSGDLIINGKSTKHFRDSEWDAYRNNSVGFIFQSYNLIPHLSVIDNVEMGMTLSGVSADEKHKKATAVLAKVGLSDHVHKRPNQLSGGQMQRVAIARALANDPDIILADEPTGALDTTTSAQIMDLIKEIATDKLVIMVTHNAELAEKYADRVVRFRDGEVVDDTNPYDDDGGDTGYQLKKTSMSFATALKLSGKNIATKKWRTALTAFASSIGIIGIALILSLSTGFQLQIDKFQSDALSEFPIIISQTAMNMDAETMSKIRGEMRSRVTGKKNYEVSNEVHLYDPSEETLAHTNLITEAYLDYLDEIDPQLLSSIGYTRMTGMNLLRRVDDVTKPVSVAIGTNRRGGSGNGDMRQMASGMSSMRSVGLSSYPEPFGNATTSYLEENYDLLAGSYPHDETDLILVVDNQNRIDKAVLSNLGFTTEGVASIAFDEIVGTELKLISNDDYYLRTPIGTYRPGTDYAAMYEADDSLSLAIAGIVRLKPDVSFGIVGEGIAYSDRLVQRVIERGEDSEIVSEQREADYNVITMQNLDKESRRSFMAYLGGDSTPFMIYLYPTDFAAKESVLAYLDAYNKGKPEAETIIYSDLASSITEMTDGIMSGITLVLIGFASISLVVSLIMIGIITYISVLERTKEIGVLRALGARKKDITRVFNAETFIIGGFSGALGIGLAYLLDIPINKLIEQRTQLANVAQLNPIHALLLLAISVGLTLLGGLIPARMAAKKDPVEALRTE